MRIENFLFEVFERNNFVYRIEAEDAPRVKNEYVLAWNRWKEIVSQVVESSRKNNLVVENTEHWQNSGNLRRRFWSRIKDKNHLNNPSCIAAMISKDNLRIYLEWHGYKNEPLIQERKKHNGWIAFVSNWVQENDINPSEYRVWMNHEKDEDFRSYRTLKDLLDNKEIRLSIQEALNQDDKSWVRIGKIFDKNSVLSNDSVIYEMGDIASKLNWLYKQVLTSSFNDLKYTEDDESQDSRFWLFNVYYSKEPNVWKQSTILGVAAMQYEYGRESRASVTKNLNIIKEISEGDKIVAYTGNKGLLGYGIVDRPFFEEGDDEKFIQAMGANWRQRIGVKWLKTLDTPITYQGVNFIKDIGVLGSPVMGSSTIFELSFNGYDFCKGLINEELPKKIREDKLPNISTREIIDHIDNYIKSKGFYFEHEEIVNLFLSLKTKPFVILSGISGTGKTMIIKWFAESVGATDSNGQFKLIPIRPDWNDGSDLLGYVDIQGEFKEGPLTKVIKNAHQNPELPYFVLLDEMNLARVEYYFSDILSVMESRKWENGEVVSSTLLSSDVYGEDVTLPNNLYIIGTVNMDETTHPFSKKVLDRANTIEFNRVNLGNLAFLTELEEVEPKVIGQDRFASKYLHLKDVYKEKKEIVAKATDELVRINESLQLINAHVGYRVRDEICFYLVYNEESNLMKFENAFDHCILQKILPRIAGSDTRVEQMLRGLFSHFTNRDYEEDQNGQIDIQNARYPRSAAKVAEMLGRLRNDGFTSFWIS
ncbi:HI_0552 family protein [Cytobacillus oceanisediminis]|uniref:HI_0552 family protein n=1 Tax=Cytobacillus oceanisediminis TaxID=665099 RepID=UPI0011AA4E1E|nr:HI_0552 family protein [Cytobacillus oceanisediminis]